MRQSFTGNYLCQDNNMAFNGSGVFVRLYNWVNDANAGIKISSTRMDAETDGIATGLTTCITKDGQTTPTANLPMGNFIHTGVGNAAARTSYASAAQVQDGSLTYGNTVAGTGDAITFNTTPVFAAYAAGQKFSFIAGAANTGATTVNINSLGVKSITKNGTTALAAGDIPGSGALVQIEYDGTRFQIYRPATSTTSIVSVKKQTFTVSGTYTPSTGMAYCIVEVQAAGGGGGGCSAAGLNAGGGAAGTYARALLAAVDVGASKTVTIGAAGAAGANTGASGGAGGSSGFGTASAIINCQGGGAGSGNTGATGTSGGATGGDASGTGVNLSIPGGYGGFGINLPGSNYHAGNGGDSFFGAGGAIQVLGSAAAGVNGTGYGAGGSGACGAGTTANIGGSGGAGFIIITEYCTS